MATAQERSWCVLEYHSTQSVIQVQRDFRRRFQHQAPSHVSIKKWYRDFVDRGCICDQRKGHSGRPSVNAVIVERVRETFVRSPKKSVRRASQQLNIPKSTVSKVLRTRLKFHPYKLQLVQKLAPDDPAKRLDFSEHFMELMEDDENLSGKIIFSDEATFHVSGKVNGHNVRIWGSENPHVILEVERDSPKVNIFCAVSRHQVYGPFFFQEATVTGPSYLDMLTEWLFPQLEEEGNEFIFQQDGAPPHWHLNVRGLLNERLPGRWIGRAGNEDNVFYKWPPRSPDLTVCDFFLWGYIKDRVYIPPFPQNLQEVRLRITAAIQSISPDMLQRVWHEWEYRLDVCSVTRGGHIQCL